MMSVILAPHFRKNLSSYFSCMRIFWHGVHLDGRRICGWRGPVFRALARARGRIPDCVSEAGPERGGPQGATRLVLSASSDATGVWRGFRQMVASGPGR